MKFVFHNRTDAPASALPIHRGNKAHQIASNFPLSHFSCSFIVRPNSFSIVYSSRDERAYNRLCALHRIIRIYSLNVSTCRRKFEIVEKFRRSTAHVCLGNLNYTLRITKLKVAPQKLPGTPTYPGLVIHTRI